MKKLIVAVLTGALLALASTSFASFTEPKFNIAGDGIEDVGGNIYSTYQNSGDFLYVQTGNNLGSPSHLLEVQNALNAFLHTTNISLVQNSHVAITLVDGDTSGTWTVEPTYGVLSFYAIKAGNAFAMYELDPAAGTGSWSTFDLEIAGHPGEELEFSHFTGYEGTPVPEPGTVMLLGAGIFGLAVFQKRRSNNRA